MIRHNRILTRSWMLLPVAVLLVVSHALILRYALQHKGLSASVAGGVMILIVVKHLGLFSAFYARFRRRSRQ